VALFVKITVVVSKLLIQDFVLHRLHLIQSCQLVEYTLSAIVLLSFSCSSFAVLIQLTCARL
jgi:hypothetical protein